MTLTKLDLEKIDEGTTPAKFIEDRIHQAFVDLAEAVNLELFELEHPAPLIRGDMYLVSCWHKFIRGSGDEHSS